MAFVRKFRQTWEQAKIAAHHTPKASWLIAALLLIVVLGVFTKLHNYGPESAVREFHRSLEKIYIAQTQGQPFPDREWNRLRSLIIEDIGEPNRPRDANALAAIQFTYDQLRRGAVVRLARMDRRPREVLAAVTYQFPDPAVPPLIRVWVVQKPTGRRSWKISAARSAQIEL